MPISILVPDVENRISAWIEISERTKKEQAQEKKTKGITVTISREFGCEAFPVAEKLKERLEEKTNQKWIILDKELIERVAHDTKLSKSLIKDFGMVSTFIHDFFSSFKTGGISKNQVFKQIAEIILRVAKEGNAIIIGRGAAVITEHLDNCHHFRLEAPLEYRIDSIARRANLDRDTAEKVVIENQEKRVRFLKEFLNVDAHDPKYYDAIFNNSKDSIESITESILTYVEKSLN